MTTPLDDAVSFALRHTDGRWHLTRVADVDGADLEVGLRLYHVTLESGIATSTGEGMTILSATRRALGLPYTEEEAK